MKTPETKEFISTLFNPEDTICICPTLYENLFVAANDWNKVPSEFLCINPVQGERKDKSVTTYRNFLIEMDNLELRDQLTLIKAIGLPYSTLTFSGGKSFHYIISLEDPLSSQELYAFTARWIHNVIEHADPATRNPSRLTRFPNGLRRENGKTQKLIYAKGRVKNDELMTWLESHQAKVPSNPPIRKVLENNALSKERSSVIEVVDWYVQEYLSQFYGLYNTFVQCPLCAEDGRDTSGDNLCISGKERYFHCFAVDEHNKGLLKEMIKLRRTHGLIETSKTGLQ